MLNVPAGASATDLTIVVSAPRARRSAPAGTLAVAPPVRLSPEDATFLKPLEVTIPIAPVDLPAGFTLDDVIVVRAAQNSEVFVPLPTRRTANAVVCQTEHFSDFIAVVISGGDGGMPFGTCGDAVCSTSESCQGCPLDCGLCVPSVDSTPPRVFTVSPAFGDSTARGDVVVKVTFDEPILAQSVDASKLVLTRGSVPVDGVVSVNGNVVRFTPFVALAPLTMYSVFIGSVQDRAGNPSLPAATEFTTTAGANLVSSRPLAAATGVNPSSTLLVTFTKGIDFLTWSMQPDDGPCTGSIQLMEVGTSNCFGGTLEPSVDAESIAITPRFDLPGLTMFRLVATSAVRDADGFSLTSAVANTFTTGADTRPPTVISVSPRAGTVGVGPHTPVVITFEEPVLVGGTEDAISVSAGEGYASGTITVAGATVTFTPTPNWDAGSSHWISVEDVTDRAGNWFAGSLVGTFMTNTLIVAPDAQTITIRPTTSYPAGTTVTWAIDSSVHGDTGFPVYADPEMSFTVSTTGTTGYAMYMANLWDPNATLGIAALDANCESARPSNIRPSKAFVLSASRHPCDATDCSTGAAPVDWVLSAATSYICDDGTPLFTTDATLPIFTGWPLVARLGIGGAYTFLFGGSSQWMPTADDCSDFTSNVGSASLGDAGMALDSSALSASVDVCNSYQNSFCVEQVPAVAPPTH